jgi:hypothetical protein
MALAAEEAVDAGEDDMPRTASGERLTDAAADQIGSRLNESTREARCTIKRLNEHDGKFATLDVVDASLVTEEWIQKTYGGGKYRVLTNGPTANGRWGYVRMDSYEIDLSVPFRGSMTGRAKPTVHNADGSVVGSAGADNDMAMLMKTQIVELVQSSADLRQRDRESSTTMQTMMMSMMSESAKQSREFMQLMLTMMGSKPTGPSLTELLGAITPLVAPLLGSRKDPIEVATQLMALTGGNRSGGSPLSEVLAAVKELRETADLFGPQEREEDSSLLGTITRMAPQLLTMLTAQQQRELAAAPVAVPTATATLQPNPPVFAPVATASTEDGTMGLVTAMLKPYAGMLVERAMADDDPFDLGHSLAVMIPVAMRDAVAAFIEQESAAAELIAAIPELSPYPAWVGEFINGIRERFNPTEEPDDDEVVEPPIVSGGASDA